MSMASSPNGDGLSAGVSSRARTSPPQDLHRGVDALLDPLELRVVADRPAHREHVPMVALAPVDRLARAAAEDDLLDCSVGAESVEPVHARHLAHLGRRLDIEEIADLRAYGHLVEGD